MHVDAPAETFAASCHELAKSEGTWTWGSTRSSVVADRSVVEFTVGEATLEWQPAEVADVVGRLIEET